MGLASHGRNLAFQIGNPKPRLLIRVHYCSYKSESKKQEDDETVREICTILKRSREWESVLSSSGFPKKLNPCVVRSVLQQHHQIFNCFGRQFCLHFEAFHIGTAPVYMAFLRFMGDDDEAKQFTYSLEVGGGGRKLTWQGIPRSIRDSHQKVRDSQDGLIIQRNLALFFSGGNRQELKLKVAGRIRKEH